MSALAALLFVLGTRGAQAQLPVFNGLDWLLDRGNVSFDAVTNSGIPLRQGINAINALGNNPGHGVRRWTFPRTFDINGGTTTVLSEVVDNPNTADPQNYQDLNFNNVRTSSVYATQTGLVSQFMAHAYLNGAWNLPLVPNDFSPADYRTPLRGFSLTSDSSQTYSFDYAYVNATHNDFLVDQGNGQTRPATPGELAALPYTSSAAYAGIQSALVNDTHPRATYSSGAYNLIAGNYNVDIYSPGDGTFIGGVSHPNVTRALVRVSWFRTVDATGQIVKANTEDPVTSRLYEVDLSQAGWIRLQGGGSGPAIFPYDGDPRDQIAVTIYSITPDTYIGAGDPVYNSSPLVTADAVRFTGTASGGSGLTLPPVVGPPALPQQTISAQGRILGPAVGTGKLLFTSGGVPIGDVQPLVFFAREESVPDPRPVFPTDPTQPVSGTNPLIPDPTATITAPVFYCVDSQDGNLAGNSSDLFLSSAQRVRWRYVGIADASSTNSTSAASPAIANVRCRDGNIRTIVYFMTTDSTGALGHIYAFDAAGNRNLLTTQNYWIYPSYRPLTAAELAANKLPPEAHDPNYIIPAAIPNPYPVGTWGADAPDPFFHHDGEIVPNTSNAGEYIVRTDTRLPAFGGVQGSPVIMDDPGNPAGGQMLVIGNLNGRVYSFDAGGRGDFNPADITSTGTTKRIWTWPHFGADAYYARGFAYPTPNKISDETSLGSIPSSLTFDPSYPAPVKPMLVPGGDGHLYAININHDTVPAYNPGTGRATWAERRIWMYPAADNSGLGGPLTTAAVFQPAGATIANVYFNCAGRAYALPEAPPALAATPPTVNTLKWVFPKTPNPPFADPNDPTTAPLTVGFGGNAPVLLSATTLNGVPPFAGSPNVANDYCYVLTGDGILIGLNAFDGTLLATGASPSGARTSSSPIASQLLGLPDITGGLGTPAESNTQPTIIFSDEQGSIYGLAARPDNTTAGPFGGFNLGLTWGHHETPTSRYAAAAVFNGYILEGDAGGQMHAYGIGGGPNGLDDTLPPGEPIDQPLGGTVGSVSIDMRVLNFYKKVDWDQMAKPTYTGTNTTALVRPGGGSYQGTRQPANGNVNVTTAKGPYAADWGEMIYVAAAGVYHAQPQNEVGNPFGATSAPVIHVTFTIQLQNGNTITRDVPLIGITPHTGGLWPDDKSLSTADHDSLQINGDAYDPATMVVSRGTQTGTANNVFPWIAVASFRIDPTEADSTGKAAAYPAGQYHVHAQAFITQDTATSNTWNFATGEPNTDGITAPGAVAQPQPNRANERQFYVTNPIAMTTRGITNINDMTGANNPNVIGLFPSINAPTVAANAGELVNNGNNQFLGGQLAGASYKPVFAPLPMVGDGATSTYSAVDNVGNPVPAFYIVDRSNLSNTAQFSKARKLQIRVVATKGGWHGWQPSANPTATGSSVMNPLPWELLPTDAQDTPDYPSIPKTAFSVQKVSGEDAISGTAYLASPNFPSSDPATRTLVATQFNLQVKVPRFQPANVNYGVHSFGGQTFGSAFMDMSSVNRGDPTAATAYNQHILGPLIVNTGGQANLGSAPAYPAGGYMGNIKVETVPTTIAAQTTTRTGNSGAFNPGSTYAQTQVGNNGANVDTSGNAFRSMDFGISVPPGVKMRIAETTLDEGKVPMGTGYTPLINQNDPRSFQVPFEPDMQPSLAGPFYWDDATRGGQFFQPFTLYNESNVNLVDLRIAKLIGQNHSIIDGRALSQYTDPTAGVEATSHAVAEQLISDQVNHQSIPPLFGVAFKNVSGALGVGNAGIVSSFDHISSSSNPTLSLYAERSLWPPATGGILNPFVTAADIVSANQNYGAMLPTANNLAGGIVGWVDGHQPQPTVGKPRVGDSQGRIATIPDQPYSGNATFQRPKVGIAIPLGTPVGTYSAPIYAYEDNTPLQWQEWLSHYAKPAGVSENYPTPHDGILNISQAGSPAEPKTDPTAILKVTVREAKLSREPTTGTLAMLDPQGSWNANGFTTPPGSDNFPAPYMAPGPAGNVFNRNLYMYWPTNRQPAPNGYIGPNGLPRSYAPYLLNVSSVPAPYSAVSGTSIILGDFDFGNAAGLSGNGAPLSAWWTPPFQMVGLGAVNTIFPTTAGASPFLAGTANVDTVRYLHPAVASSVDFSGGYGAPNPNDPEAYLFWQSSLDKVTGANGLNLQTRDSRISWQSVFGGANPGQPNGPIYNVPDDPTVTKLAPRPLLVKLPAAGGAPAQKFLYVFWHEGNQSNASIAYNAMVETNMATPFNNTKWLVDINNKFLGDQKLPTSGALVWQSDPAPVYRHVPDPYVAGQMDDVIDVVYTGVLKGRQTVETLLSRYKINRVKPVNVGDPPIGSLTLIPIKKVVGEPLTRVGNTQTYQARDAGWALGTGPLGTFNPAVDLVSQISVYRQVTPGAAPQLLNDNGSGAAQVGVYDQASGFLTFNNSVGGGQILVDMRSGTVRFPQVGPGLSDTILVNYIPFVMRLNTSRDDSNIDRSLASNLGAVPNARAFKPAPSITSSGNNTSPVVIFDRVLNPRAQLTAPSVIFPAGATPTLDRMWVLYRKNDPSGVAKSTIYYKAMRLMVKLPFPVMLQGPAQAGGPQQMTTVNVNGNVGPYEVDWVRGRIYFTEADENSQITVSYTYYDPVSGATNQNSGNLVYRVAWGDEMSASIQQGDQTTPETTLPTDSAVSEGQVSAFKDPFLDKLWVFWSSTRAGSTDLYYETIAPPLYPTASNQR